MEPPPTPGINMTEVGQLTAPTAPKHTTERAWDSISPFTLSQLTVAAATDSDKVTLIPAYTHQPKEVVEDDWFPPVDTNYVLPARTFCSLGVY